MPRIDFLPAWLVSMVTLILIFTAILWALLPFAVFGIKERLDRQLNNLGIIDEQLTNTVIAASKHRGYFEQGSPNGVTLEISAIRDQLLSQSLVLAWSSLGESLGIAGGLPQ